MATYLVTQATGGQSQWVIRHLLDAGAKIHAVVRDPKKIPLLLEKPGITIFKGNSTNFDEIFEAAKGCKGVFLNTYPVPGEEVKQAETVAKACKEAGVESIVACTTMCTGNKDMWDDQITEDCNLRGYYASKFGVEEAVRGGGFKAYTILRPAFIHVNYFIPGTYQNFKRLPTHGELDHLYEDGVTMPHTDAHDIGRYAAAALQDPAKFGGQEIEMGFDDLTIEEARDILVRVSGRKVEVKKRTVAELEELNATVFAHGFHLWGNAKGYKEAVAAAKAAPARYGIPMTSFEDALKRDKALLLECLPA